MNAVSVLCDIRCYSAVLLWCEVDGQVNMCWIYIYILSLRIWLKIKVFFHSIHSCWMGSYGTMVWAYGLCLWLSMMRNLYVLACKQPKLTNLQPDSILDEPLCLRASQVKTEWFPPSGTMEKLYWSAQSWTSARCRGMNGNKSLLPD